MARGGLDIGFLLDRRWHWLRGEIEHQASGTVARRSHPRHGGDPLLSVDAIPRSQLEDAGFRLTGRYSKEWIGPEDTPVRFTDDPALADAVTRAERIDVEGTPLRIIRRADLLREKLRSGSDPAHRRSKRLQDLADAQALLETDPALATELTADERRILDRLPQ